VSDSAYASVAELVSVTELRGFIVERQSVFSRHQTVVGQLIDRTTHAYTQHNTSRRTYLPATWTVHTT